MRLAFCSVSSALLLKPLPDVYSASFNPNQVPKNNKIKAEIEFRVCVNRTCRRQGSRETLEILSGLAPADVSVNSCGCLGRCGSGPNLVVLPDGIMVRHCGTPSRAAEVMLSICGGSNDSLDVKKNLEALALRKRGEEAFEKGAFAEAELLLSQALGLKPFGGLHIIHTSRSAARLAVGNTSGALEDAEAASTLAPQYPKAYICQADAFLAKDEFEAAEKSYSIALQIDPSIRRSKSFKVSSAFFNSFCGKKKDHDKQVSHLSTELP
ncbi:uncharacterized protein LOC122079053 isoform X2 [Macadamia integrifolia]|uniref:uncharacterized protein LOC122079053 isoform X2 n=1 Tax=Macadamia integrifolia TaxID=60698 RepID=UPI001C4FC2D1|nr:uncharacterized protein LOC122079053 isoform X2 [Macadamia integrifolia]